MPLSQKEIRDRAAVNAQKSGKGAQKDSTAQLRAALIDARDAYQALAKVARAALSQEDQAKLGLGKEPRGTAAGIGTCTRNSVALCISTPASFWI